MSLASDAASLIGAPSFVDVHLQELDMPQGDKSADTAKEKRQVGAIKKGQKSVSRPGPEVRALATFNKHQGGGKSNGPGRKVPFGPVGGSGRKTNLARSS